MVFYEAEDLDLRLSSEKSNQSRLQPFLNPFFDRGSYAYEHFD
jgi:hypothetical protein